MAVIPHRRSPRFLMAIGVLVTVLACNGLSASAPPTTAPAGPASPEPPSTEQGSPTVPPALPSASPTAFDVGGPLNADGPWLVFFVGEGVFAEELWAVNPDGTGLSQLVSDLIVVPRDLEAALSPSGARMALITAADHQLRGLQLNLLSLPDGSREQVTALTSAQTEKSPDADPALRPPEPAVAIAEEASLAWSPDGTKLAFMGAFEGPSSDLYVYDLLQSRMTRLTDGPSQGIRPHWSTDGNTILHFGVETLGSGAGYSMEGAWAAAADGSGVISLYDPSNGDGEQVVGWVGDRTFVVFTFSQRLGGRANLRAVDVDTAEMRMLWQGLLTDVALDPESGAIIVSAAAGDGHPPGTYLVDPATGGPIRIIDEAATGVTWSPEVNLFFVSTEIDVLGISSDGQIIDLGRPGPATGFPTPAAGTSQVAWRGAGLWLSSLPSDGQEPPRRIFERPVQWVEFAPGGVGLLFLAEGDLYAAGAPDFAPNLIFTELPQHRHAWVVP